MVKVVFSDEESKDINGFHQGGNRNCPKEIVIYKSSDDKLRTFIHEIIHHSLFETARKGHNTRVFKKMNKDEVFVDSLAVELAAAIREHKDKLDDNNVWKAK